MAEAAERVKACSICGALDTRDPCAICADPARDGALICVVEEVGALWAMERGGAYRGRYHVLGGAAVGRSTASARRRCGWRRSSPAPASGAVKEVILALPATVDGQTTAHYLADRLAGSGVAVTSWRAGVPVGGELDWLDDGTIAQALRAGGRRRRT